MQTMHSDQEMFFNLLRYLPHLYRCLLRLSLGCSSFILYVLRQDIIHAETLLVLLTRFRVTCIGPLDTDNSVLSSGHLLANLVHGDNTVT